MVMGVDATVIRCSHVSPGPNFNYISSFGLAVPGAAVGPRRKCPGPVPAGSLPGCWDAMGPIVLRSQRRM